MSAIYPANETHAVAGHRRLHGRVLDMHENVLAYDGIDPTGVADSTTAIRDAINAASSGGVVLFPPGIYKYSTLDLTDEITLRGTGWHTTVNAAFNDSQWSSNTLTTGTILRSTSTSTSAIKMVAANKKYKIQDLCLIGPGSGTSHGIEMGTASNSFYGELDNTMVANFGGAAYRMKFAITNNFHNLKTRGCKTGISLSDGCNNNQFTGMTEVQYTDTDAILVTANNAQNLFDGGLIQNCTGDGLDISGTSSCFDGFYIENPGITNSVLFRAGSRHALRDSYLSTTDDDIAVDASACVLDNLRIGGGITVTGADNIFNNCDPVGTFTDSGVGTIRIYGPNGRVFSGTGYGTGNTAAATSLGAVARKMQIYDMAGNSLGFIPIYDAIT